jgi:hypothetical protein
MHPSLRATDHRPDPLPTRPWALAMVWHDLLFAHWPVASERLTPHLPPGLTLDLYDGKAWLGVVPFRMRGVRPRCLPALPGLSAFPETNLRTYVIGPDGRAGVWFFSLEADQRVAVKLARAMFGLRYLRARMRCAPAGGGVDYISERNHPDEPPATLRVRYRPTGPILATHDAQARFLTARYCMYMNRPLRTPAHTALYRGDIHHAPWPLQTAHAEFTTCTLADEFDIPLLGPPHLLFARRLDVVAWLPVRV